LVTVAVIAAEVVPTSTDPKSIVVGATVMPETPVPIPDIVIEKFSESMPIDVLEDFAPSDVGWNS
jgi:hypothetical protein